METGQKLTEVAEQLLSETQEEEEEGEDVTDDEDIEDSAELDEEDAELDKEGEEQGVRRSQPGCAGLVAESKKS